MYKLSEDVWNSMILQNPHRMDPAFFYVRGTPSHSNKCTYDDYLYNSHKWTANSIWGRNSAFYESVRKAEREKFVKEDEALNGAYEIPETVCHKEGVVEGILSWFNRR